LTFSSAISCQGGIKTHHQLSGIINLSCGSFCCCLSHTLLEMFIGQVLFKATDNVQAGFIQSLGHKYVINFYQYSTD